MIRIFVSWIPVNRDNKFVELLYKITEPVLSPVRNLIARIAGQMLPIDFSPIIVLLLMALLRHFILRIIVRI
ncbi:MAG: YggT family protein [Clostridiaceae bacterium]|nr:YggT family protein [Clostridiaceae bacterium]